MIKIKKMLFMNMILTNILTSFLQNIPIPAYSVIRSITMKTQKISKLNNIIIDPKYKPKTQNQELYYKYLKNNDIKLLFCVGPAGTGKTLFACDRAINELKNNKISKIILTRPVVPVEEDIGFLPGSLNKKMDPWVRPIMDIFEEYYSTKEIETMMQKNIIEISPLAYMRGRTFKNAFIIADEMQNSSPNQMLMLTTRLGINSKMVITGDLKQSDKGFHSGLSDFINKYKTFYNYKNSIMTINNTINLNGTYQYNGIVMIEMRLQDIERSDIVKQILEIYENKEINQNIYDKPIESIKEIKNNKIIKNEEDLNSYLVMNKTDLIQYPGYVGNNNVSTNSSYNNNNNNNNTKLITSTKYKYINDAALIPNDPLKKY
jgi:phosphate starvation-inducible PhoH-like protein